MVDLRDEIRKAGLPAMEIRCLYLTVMLVCMSREESRGPAEAEIHG